MSIFNIRSLFGESPAAPEAAAAAVPVAQHLQELVVLPWIPVLQVRPYLAPI